MHAPANRGAPGAPRACQLLVVALEGLRLRIIQFSLTIDFQAFNHGDDMADYSGYID